jgi:membrane-associated phospholipid phosphatase
MKKYRLKFLFLVFWGIFLVNLVYSQTIEKDSSFHPYHVNYWITAPICGVGFLTNYLGIAKIKGKPDLTPAELQGLNRNIVNDLDKWALNQDPTQIGTWESYSDYTITTIVVLPALLLFDKQMRKDWFDLLLMYSEAISITSNIYEWSFLGPTFQNRFRPAAYYEQLSSADRITGNNRNSFYSGHVASCATATFFMAQVYIDYHPEIGNSKYLLYGAATIPPLIMGYVRVKALKHFTSDVMVGLGLGALCGIVIPELHYINDKNITLGLYSSPEAIGIAMTWQTDFLK